VTDQRPPRLAGDETAILPALLGHQRESFLRKVAGIDDEMASRSPGASGATLLWLTNHLADAERIWLLHRFSSADPSDDPPHASTIAEASDRYRATWSTTDQVIAAAVNLDAECPPFDDGPTVSLRWILLHLLEETARHAGQADILRELLDGTTGR
jgi:uncharacterized damage-inducible protein DinB